MGNDFVNDVFNGVARRVNAYVEHSVFTTTVGQAILTELIEQLQDIDWDTEYESLEEFKDVPYIVQAFADCEVALENEEDETGKDPNEEYEEEK